MAEKQPRRALGRGLDALLPTTGAPKGYQATGVFSCAIERIVAQKGQPRRHFDKARLEELSQSIKEHGLLEPLVVRRAPGHADKFEIIAGERRWRASQRAGLKEVLVVVKDVSPKSAFELALVENVQREDLNPIELAEAYDRLVKEHGYTQDALATRVHKDRATVTNVLRLLKLPVGVRNKIVSGELSEGHGRALLGADGAQAIEQLAEKVIRGQLNVRATEALVRGQKKKKEGKGTSSQAKTASVRDLEQRLSRTLGTKVEVRDKGNRGEIAIPYADLDALDRVLDKIL